MKNKILILIISFFFSISLFFSIQVNRYYVEGSISVLKHLKFNYVILLLILLFSILVYIVLKKVLKKISNFEIVLSDGLISERKIFFVSFISIFISGLIFLLTFYPGVAIVDSYQFLLDPIGYSFQYPLVYSIIQSKIFYLFYHIVKSMNISFFLLSLLQLIFMSFVISYVIKWSHKTFKNNKLTIFSILYFNLFFIFSNINVAHLRDSYFSAFFLLLMTVLYDIVKTNGQILKDEKFIIKFIIIISGLLLSRNNGFIVVFVVLFIIFIRYYKQNIKKILILIAISIFTYSIPRLLPNNFSQSLAQESLAIPFQQISCSIKFGNVSVEDQKVISEIIPIQYIDARYNGYTFDNLKWSNAFNNFELNSKKKKFINIWIKNMIPNYKQYTKAYILNTIDLWGFSYFKFQQGVILDLSNNNIIPYQYFSELNNKPIFPKSIQNVLVFIYRNYTLYFNNGFLFWVYIFLSLVLSKKNKKKFLLVFVPFYIIWINLMVAAPLASAFRYMAMFGYCLPFMIGITFSKETI